MPFAHLQNVCAETAIKCALEQFFSHITVTFNVEKNALNDFQIPLFFVYKNIPGQNEQLTQLQDKKAIEELLRSTLRKNKIYCVRTGINDGAGHYSFLRYENGIWRISTGPNNDIALTDAKGTLDQSIFEQEFRILNPQKCGIGNGQYSLRINELNTARAICAMNYIAIFRQQSQVEGIEFAEMMTNGNFDDLIKAQDVFLHLTVDALRYWQLSNALTCSADTELEERNNVYTFQLLEHDNAEFLAKLLALDGFNINAQDELGRTLLHRAVQNKSTNAVRALLEQGITLDIKDRFFKTAQDYLMEMDMLPNRQELFPIQSCFELLAIRRAIANQDELRDLLREACTHNNAKGIELLMKAARLPSQDYLVSLSALLQTKEDLSFSWNTIEESLFWLLDKLFEVDESATQNALNMLFDKGFNFNYEVYAQGDLHKKTLLQLAQTHGRKGIDALLHNATYNNFVPQVDKTLLSKNGSFLRENKSLTKISSRQEAIISLNELLDNYLRERQEGKALPREKYFWGSFFGGGFTYNQKLNAVNALKQVLAGEVVDLEAHLDVLRDGTLGATLRQFIRTPFPAYEIRVQAHCLVGGELSGNRIRDFIRDLAAHTMSMNTTNDNKQVNFF